MLFLNKLKNPVRNSFLALFCEEISLNSVGFVQDLIFFEKFIPLFVQIIRRIEIFSCPSIANLITFAKYFFAKILFNAQLEPTQSFAFFYFSYHIQQIFPFFFLLMILIYEKIFIERKLKKIKSAFFEDEEMKIKNLIAKYYRISA